MDQRLQKCQDWTARKVFSRSETIIFLLNFVRHRPKAMVVERLKGSSKSSNLKQLLRGNSSGNISSVPVQLKERGRRGL